MSELRYLSNSLGWTYRKKQKQKSKQQKGIYMIFFFGKERNPVHEEITEQHSINSLACLRGCTVSE